MCCCVSPPTGPPGVYGSDVAGLYMGEQHMMRPPGKIKAIRVNDLVVVCLCFIAISRLHYTLLVCITVSHVSILFRCWGLFVYFSVSEIITRFR